ncbi:MULTISPECIES: RHS domain-containing protein [unclassified Delftia]|uniref:RHS domain-containing protein n=1 Tax=unclassified Delftia TaxID=2613839 RepID=UPI001F47C1BB|nr:MULTISPECIES: RHS domain-containing protein [unclassified Delftia]
MTDEQGQVAWAADYKVWGEAVMPKCCGPAPVIGRSARGLGGQSLLHHLHRRRLSSPSGYRGSSLMKRRGCITTGFGSMIQALFNDHTNNAIFYQIEDLKPNMSHKYEPP